ncbi:MAG: hypothetical protein HYV65_02215 [Candidatus Spechtbacteria bacterium]|nr:hypothetical protein [Candidatus Spechtbacteria bacterium]
MKTSVSRHLFLFASLVILAGIAAGASALSKQDIVYPIDDLGSCKNESECKLFCNQPQNVEACVVFAEKYSLLSQQDIQRAKKALTIKEGPGGCTGRACEAYCDDTSHIAECLDFAEKNDLIPPEELAEGRKVQAALAKGTTLPGGCKTKNECDSYCNDSSHMEECITFAEAAGFIPPNELAEAKKVLSAIKKGVKPPPCGGKSSCDVYCGEPSHFEECIIFAEAAELIPPNELAEARQVLSAIRKGVNPPACRGREQCDIYCQEPEHTEECINFAEAAGFMSSKDAEMARKTGGKGPGGCSGQNECEQFCQNPENQETCFLFAKEHGLISEEDLQKMNEGARQIQESLNQAPPEVRDCLVQAVGQNKLDKILSGEGMMSSDLGDKMRVCFESMMPPDDFRGSEERMGGPGGCQTQEECMAYCQEHPEECGSPPINESIDHRQQEGEGFGSPPNNEGLEGSPPIEAGEGSHPPSNFIPGNNENLPPMENFNLQQNGGVGSPPPVEFFPQSDYQVPAEGASTPTFETSPVETAPSSPSSSEPSSDGSSGAPELGANLLFQAKQFLQQFVGILIK